MHLADLDHGQIVLPREVAPCVHQLTNEVRHDNVYHLRRPDGRHGPNTGSVGPPAGPGDDSNRRHKTKHEHSKRDTQDSG